MLVKKEINQFFTTLCDFYWIRFSDVCSWNCFVFPRLHNITLNGGYLAWMWIAARKYRHGYCFLIRYQLCARFRVRAAYYVGDLLISTSNPPATHSSATKPRYWGSPRLLESIIEHLPRLKYLRFNLSYDASRSYGFYLFPSHNIYPS